ncbi:hypothetical protein DFH29DRAFT_1005338 [Suillus ampliporus]|nr:hypothetical protein DFH29DRAFT_1005338 [Suillus ampliporus]
MNQTPYSKEMDLFDRQSSPPPRYINPSAAFPLNSAAFPLASDNYIYEQFGGGRWYQEPAVELTPSRLRSNLKAMARDTGVIKGASIQRRGGQKPTTDSQGSVESGPSAASLDLPQDDDATPSDSTSLTVALNGSRQPSPFTGDATSLTVAPGNSRHSSPFVGDVASRPPAPAPLQDMFYNSMSDQPAWTGQFDLMGTDSFTTLLRDHAPDPSGFVQGFSGQVPAFELQCPSHLAPQAAHAPPPSTNVILPTPLKDLIPGSSVPNLPSPRPSQQLDLSHYSPDTSVHERFPEESLTSHSKEPPVVGRRSAETNAALDAGFVVIDQALLELARSTTMPMHQVINLFMKSRGRTVSSINYWNLYSNYFKDKSKQELA